jgi:hypothetical protein
MASPMGGIGAERCSKHRAPQPPSYLQDLLAAGFTPEQTAGVRAHIRRHNRAVTCSIQANGETALVSAGQDP